MFKFGVFQAEDYFPPPGLAGSLQRFLARDRISLQLLRTTIPATPREIDVFEAIMSGLQLSSGVFRTTFHDRFRDLDPDVNSVLAERFRTDQPLKVHDWAASDCLTSSEWASSLFAVFPQATLEASDLSLFLVEITLPDGTALIMEGDGKPLQYVTPRFVLNWHGHILRPRLAAWLLTARANAQLARVKSRISTPDRWMDSMEDSMDLPPLHLKKLSMIHPEAEAFSRRDPRFSIQCHSAFTSLALPVHVIRSMNIFNLAYFSPVRLAEGANAVWSSLLPGGCWVVGRTWRNNPPASNVSIFEKTGAGFRLLRRHGEGSEIEDLILERNYL